MKYPSCQAELVDDGYCLDGGEGARFREVIARERVGIRSC
jgi:hypothetical protein